MPIIIEYRTHSFRNAESLHTASFQARKRVFFLNTGVRAEPRAFKSAALATF